MLDKEKVQHIAKLARIGLEDKEIREFQKELSLILDYVEKLKEVDISGISRISSATELKNVFREDKRKTLSPEARKKTTEQLPQTKDGYLKVHPVRNLIS